MGPRWKGRVWGLTLALSASAWGQADGRFNVGNLAVLQVGDGSGTLTANGAAVILREYSPTGVALDVASLPGSGSSAFTLRGNGTQEGGMNLSSDGRYLVFGGYRASVGAVTPTTDATVARVVGRVGLDLSVDVSTSLSDAYRTTGPTGGAVSFRSVASDDGTRFWLAGETYVTGGLRYTTLGSSTSTSLTGDGFNLRHVAIGPDGTLHVGSATSGPGRGVFRVGSVGTLPTSGTPGLTALFSGPSPLAVQGFALLDRSVGVAGSDSLYAVDQGSGSILKHSFDGSTWTMRGSYAIPGVGGGQGGLLHLTAILSQGTVTLWATTPTAVYRVSDSALFDAAFAGASTKIADAAAHTAFRGIAFIPEPAALALLPALLLRRRD